MPKPMFRAIVNGVDISSKLDPRAISATLTDGTGKDADTLQLEIDNNELAIAPPPTGAEIQFFGGYEGNMRDFGTFIVDTAEVSGFPDKISVSAQSADAKSAQKEQRVESYDKKDFPTYGKVFEAAAGRMGLSLSISDAIKGLPNTFEMQAEEHDLQFTARLGDKLNASVSIKQGRLIVVKRGDGKSVSGKPLPVIRVARGDNVLGYSARLKDKPKHNEVVATYFDRGKVEPVEVKVAVGSDGPKFTIRTPFQTETEARHAADTTAHELKRGEGSASFEIDGDPWASAEAYVQAEGLGPTADGLWRAVTVTHNWSGTSAYNTSIECELPGVEGGGTEAAPKSKKVAPLPASKGKPETKAQPERMNRGLL